MTEPAFGYRPPDFLVLSMTERLDGGLLLVLSQKAEREGAKQILGQSYRL